MIFRVQPLVVCPVYAYGKVKGLRLKDKVWIAAVLIVFPKDRAKSTSGTDLVAAMPGVPYRFFLSSHHVTSLGQANGGFQSSPVFFLEFPDLVCEEAFKLIVIFLSRQVIFPDNP